MAAWALALKEEECEMWLYSTVSEIMSQTVYLMSQSVHKTLPGKKMYHN